MFANVEVKIVSDFFENSQEKMKNGEYHILATNIKKTEERSERFLG